MCSKMKYLPFGLLSCYRNGISGKMVLRAHKTSISFNFFRGTRDSQDLPSVKLLSRPILFRNSYHQKNHCFNLIIIESKSRFYSAQIRDRV